MLDLTILKNLFGIIFNTDMFSILIPSYNNLSYLKLCIESIKKNSTYDHQIIVHINEGSDGSLEYIKNLNCEFTYSKQNIGMPSALNKASRLANNDYIVISHDDFYYCPNWDIEFKKEIDLYNHNDFYLSGNTILDIESNDKLQSKSLDAGKTIELFDENKLLNNLHRVKTLNWQGTTKCPGLIHKDIWNKVQGWSEEFFPTGGDDTDFALKLWNSNVRIFKGLGNCFIYHFGSITTRKKGSNLNTYLGSKANKIFIKKWGMSTNFFEKYYLQSGLDSNKNLIFREYNGPLSNPNKNINYFLELLVIKLNFIYLKIINTK